MAPAFIALRTLRDRGMRVQARDSMLLVSPTELARELTPAQRQWLTDHKADVIRALLAEIDLEDAADHYLDAAAQVRDSLGGARQFLAEGDSFTARDRFRAAGRVRQGVMADRARELSALIAQSGGAVVLRMGLRHMRMEQPYWHLTLSVAALASAPVDIHRSELRRWTGATRADVDRAIEGLCRQGVLLVDGQWCHLAPTTMQLGLGLAA